MQKPDLLTTPIFPLHFDDVGHIPASHIIMHALLSDLANQFVSGAAEPIRFGLVKNEETWREVREARLRIYQEGSPHLLQLVDAHGTDNYDSNAFVFYARYQQTIVGTIRLNRHPFEVMKFIDIEQLAGFLRPSWQQQYLEVSRLAVETVPGLTGISNALVVYASLITACSTQYKCYLAYSHPKLRDRVFKFQQRKEMLRFRIPERRNIDYVLFKGIFWEDFSALITQHGAPLFDSLRRELSVAGAMS